MEGIVRAAGQHLAKSLPSVLQPVWLNEALTPEAQQQRLLLGVTVTSLAVLLVWPTARRFIVNVADTTLACILIACLIGIVIGLPVGALFLTFKALGYVCTSMGLPKAIQAAAAWLHGTLVSGQ